jgi:hypothetical protein
MDYEIKLPGDPGYAEYYRTLIQRRTETLSRRGWMFKKCRGAAGIYYEGSCTDGRRFISHQNSDEKNALLAAIQQAER